jgi:hypothetical protein
LGSGGLLILMILCIIAEQKYCYKPPLTTVYNDSIYTACPYVNNTSPHFLTPTYVNSTEISYNPLPSSSYYTISRDNQTKPPSYQETIQYEEIPEPPGVTASWV